MVKETAFYDLLGVKPDASKDQIRKAYYRKAKACHPDKHPGDKDKEAEFKAVSEAYQVLFDDEARKKYDQFGRESLNGHGGFADPRDMFAAVFGGPEFEPYIGTLRMCATVDEKLQQEVEEAAAVFVARQQELEELQGSGLVSPVEMEVAMRELDTLGMDLREKRRRLEEASAEVQKQRVRDCASFLRTRAQQYVAAGEGRRDSFREVVKQEFETLRKSNMGEPILQAIGYVYVCQTQKMLGKYGVGVHQVAGYVEEAREGFHKFAEVAGAIGSGIQLLRANYKLSRDAHAQEVGGPQAQHAKLSDEDREWYEKSIQKKMFHIVWTLTKKDIEDTVREVVDSVLLDEADHGNATAVSIPDIECRTVLSPAALLYAEAIMLMGDVFMEAMSFDQFLAKDDPPTFMERTARDIDDRAKQAGFDVAYHRKVAGTAAQEAATAAGTAINKMFGWTKK